MGIVFSVTIMIALSRQLVQSPMTVAIVVVVAAAAVIIVVAAAAIAISMPPLGD